MTKLNFIFILSALLGVYSCKTTAIQTEASLKPLPSAYVVSDTSKSKPLAAWRDVFFDANLRTLIDSALKHNFDLRIALQKIEMAKAGLRLNKGIRLPEVGVGAAAGVRRFGDYTMDGVGNFDTRFSPNLNDKQRIPNPLPDYFVGFQATWEIDIWGKLKTKKRAAAERYLASQYGKDAVITSLIAEVASAYFELMALDAELQIVKDNISLQQSALDLVTAQKQAGKANELGIEMQNAQLLNARAIQTEVQQLIIETESKLNFLCGTYPKRVQRDSSVLLQFTIPALAVGVPSDLLKNRPDIRQAENELLASKADVKTARLAFYPSLTINASLGLQAFNAMLLPELPASLAYNTLGGLAAPLLNRRQLKANLMATQSEQKQAYIHYEKMIVNGFREVFVALNGIRNGQAMFDLKKEQVAILKKSVNTSTDLFMAGKANYLEVIVSQQNTLNAQIELTVFYKRQNQSLINLYRTLGGGWQ